MATDRFGDPLPPGALARFGTRRLWHAPGLLGVEGLAFSPDGRLIATVGMDLPVVLWDVATGSEVRRLGIEPPRPEEPAGPVYRNVGPLAFSPDGASLAVGRSGGRVERWEVATGRELPAWDGHRAGVIGLAFSRDGKTLVTGDASGTILVRDADSGRVRHRFGLDGNAAELVAMAVSGDGALAATAAGRGPVALRDVGGGRPPALEASRLDLFGRSCLAVSPDGATVAAGGRTYNITLWDTRTGAVRAELTEEQDQDIQEQDPAESHGRVAALAFAPDGRTLASAGHDESVRLWDVAAGRELRRLDWADGQAEAVAFAPDGRTLAASGQARTVRLWDVATGREKVREAVHRVTVTQLAFAPDGRSLTSVGWDGSVCISDPATGEPIGRRVLLPRICYTRDLSPDGRMLAYQGLLSDRRVFVLSTKTGQELHRFDRRDRKGGDIIPVFSRDGTTLVLGDGDEDNPDEGVFVAYDLTTWKERWRFKASGEFFTDFDISPDGRTLAALWVRTLVVYETATGRVRHRLDVEDEPSRPDITAFAFSPDGASIASAISDGSIRLWDRATGRERRRFAGHLRRTSSVAFAPDGRIMATSGSGGTVLLWDVATGRVLARLEGHWGYVPGLAFSPDGQRLATGGEDTTVLTWDVTSYHDPARIRDPESGTSNPAPGVRAPR